MQASIFGDIFFKVTSDQLSSDKIFNSVKEHLFRNKNIYGLCPM